MAEISPDVWKRIPSWRASADLSAVPIEVAAQVAGILLRVRRKEGTESVGYLATVSSYHVLSGVAQATTARVSLNQSVGAFHPFNAELSTSTGSPCAEVSGSIFLTGSAVVSTGVPDEIMTLSEGGAGGVVVDRSLFVTADGARGFHWFDPTQDFYKGHFPDAPVTPGMLLLELAVKTAGECVQAEGLCVSGLAGVTDLVFEKRVFPGATVDIRVRLLERKTRSRTYAASLFCGTERVLRSRVALGIEDKYLHSKGAGKNANR